MDRHTSVCQFPAQAALETEGKMRLHGWTEVPMASQGHQDRFYAAIEVPAMDMEDPHQLTGEATSR